MRHFSRLNALMLILLVGGNHAAIADEASQQETPAKLKLNDDFSFSGYANVAFNAPSGDKATLSIDDLSLFASGHINQTLNPFVEAELAGVTLIQQGGDPLSAGYPHIVLERLYNDSYLTNKLSLRVGKMLSPVGEWNLIHAAPLVWTSSRPMVTYHGFSEYTSGASLIYAGTRGKLPDMQFYVQPGGEIRPRTLDLVVREYEHVSGLHLNWPSGLNDKLGLSIQHAQIVGTDEKQTLTGFNITKELGPLELETETIHTHISGSNPLRVRDNEWGSYLQGSYALNEFCNLNVRFEHFSARAYSRTSENAVLGVAYKSAPSTLWKLEYVNQYGQLLDIQTGLYASFAKLF